MHSLSDRFGADRFQVEGSGHQRPSYSPLPGAPMTLSAGPCSTTLPARMTMMSLASARTTFRSWLMRDRRGCGLSAACAKARPPAPARSCPAPRGRLVQHDEAGLQDHGAGNRDALPLTAREFMRIAPAGGGSPARPSSSTSIRAVALFERQPGSWIASPSATISAMFMRGGVRSRRDPGRRPACGCAGASSP